MTDDATAELTDLFHRLGARDPERWAVAEGDGAQASLARFLALKDIWPIAIDSWREVVERSLDPDVETSSVVDRLLDAGADPRDVIQLARQAAYGAVFTTLFALASSDGSPHLHELNLTADMDEVEDEDAVDLDALPGWTIVETRRGEPTGRVIRGLHESILMMDPSGQDGADLWG